MTNNPDDIPAGPSPASMTGPELRRWQLEQQVKANRRALLATAGPAATAVAVGRALDAGANPPPPRTHAAAAGLPAPARAAAGLPVENPKVWESDLPRRLPARDRDRFSADWFLGSSRARARARSKGDPGPMDSGIERAAGVLVSLFRRSGGMIRGSFRALGRMAGKGCGRDTFRRAVRFLQAEGLLTCVNVMGRDDEGQIVRRANLYLLTAPPDGPPPADTRDTRPEKPAPAESAPPHWSRWSAALRLEARSFGFNRWPARAREHPAPA